MFRFFKLLFIRLSFSIYTNVGLFERDSDGEYAVVLDRGVLLLPLGACLGATSARLGRAGGPGRIVVIGAWNWSSGDKFNAGD